MQAARMLVAIMSVFLLVGIGGLIGVLAERSMNEGDTVPRDYGEVPLDLPPGTALRQLATAGSFLVLRVAPPDGGEEVVIVDPATGRRVGNLVFAPAAGLN